MILSLGHRWAQRRLKAGIRYISSAAIRINSPSFLIVVFRIGTLVLPELYGRFLDNRQTDFDFLTWWLLGSQATHRYQEYPDAAILYGGIRAWCKFLFFPFFFWIKCVCFIKVQRQHASFTIWPTKTLPSSPQETSKPPSPSGVRSTAHLAYRATKSHEYTRTPEGNRKERNNQEGEENP